MNKGISHFVWRILALHVALLALVLTVVVLAARGVYRHAREQTLKQAEERENLLISETGHGVGAYYEGILRDLSLAKPEDQEDSDPSDPSQVPETPRPLANLAVIRQAAAQLLVQQLAGRAVLYLVDEQLQAHIIGEDRPLRNYMLTGKPPKGSAPSPLPPAPAPATTPAEIEAERFGEWIKSFGPWLKSLRNEPDISAVKLYSDKNGTEAHATKLLAIPIINVPKPTGLKPPVPRRTGWLVAAVNARHVEHNFLANLGQHGASGAFLVDESMTVFAAYHHELVGTQLDENSAPELLQALQQFRTTNASTVQAVSTTNESRANYNGSTVISASFGVGRQRFAPAIVSAYTVNMRGKPWFLLMTSPLADVDKVVHDFSIRALAWAVFVAVSMTAILVSTAAQLIFSRLKIERVRHHALQNELRQARQIQLAWLPSKTKAMCGSSLIDIASLNRPATHISGDFYNFFELPDGRTAVVIGDVTGHGTAAAFLMATTQLLIRNTLPQTLDPGKCIEQVNSQLANQVFNGQFVTMQILVIDSRTGEVQIATAGHPAPLFSDGEKFHTLKMEPQLVAGVDPKMAYPTERFRLKPNASLLLYTDGVVETEDPAGNRLRTDGLRKGLFGHVDSAEALLQRAVSAVNSFRRGLELADDLTMVAIHMHPQPRVAAHVLNSPAPVKALPPVQVH